MSRPIIYGVFRSRASRNIWLCHEMGLGFDHVPVIQANRVANPDAANAPMHTRSEDFLEINPNGQIPAMKDGDLILHESLAINLYLARRYGGELGPQTPAEDGLMTMWSFWAATGVEPYTIDILYHRVAKPPEERDAAKADAAVQALKAPFAVLNAALAATGHVVGKRFTVADINLAEVIRYAVPAPELFAEAPHVKAWLDRCQARPAFQKMWAARNAEPA